MEKCIHYEQYFNILLPTRNKFKMNTKLRKMNRNCIHYEQYFNSVVNSLGI